MYLAVVCMAREMRGSLVAGAESVCGTSDSMCCDDCDFVDLPRSGIFQGFTDIPVLALQAQSAGESTSLNMIRAAKSLMQLVLKLLAKTKLLD